MLKIRRMLVDVVSNGVLEDDNDDTEGNEDADDDDHPPGVEQLDHAAAAVTGENNFVDVNFCCC